MIKIDRPPVPRSNRSVPITKLNFP